MRRRDLVAVVAGVSALGSRAVRGQLPNSPTIGVLVIGAPGSDEFWQLFQKAMRALGYVEGQNIRYEFRSDQGVSSRLPELASELVRSKVDLIVTWFTPAATAAKQATRTIPIVMAAAGDPLATGLVESLPRPGGNITGTDAMAADLAGKCVELTHELLPTAHRMTVLVNQPDPFSKPFLAKVQLAGTAVGVSIDPIMIESFVDIDTAFAAMANNRPDALHVQPSLPVQHIAEMALKYRLPASCAFRPFVEDGGLMSYWFDEKAVYRQTAAFVDKILKGANPAELPVETPTKFDLVINLRTAKAIGVAVPQVLLQQAEDVME